MGTGVVWWQWHCGRLQRSAILRGRGSPLLLRRYIPDAESDRWQSHHRFQRLCVESTERLANEDQVLSFPNKEQENVADCHQTESHKFRLQDHFRPAVFIGSRRWPRDVSDAA